MYESNIRMQDIDNDYSVMYSCIIHRGSEDIPSQESMYDFYMDKSSPGEHTLDSLRVGFYNV